MPLLASMGWGETGLWSIGQLAQCELPGDTEVLGGIIAASQFSTTSTTKFDLGANPGRRGRKPETNHLSYWHGLQFSFLFIRIEKPD